MARENKKQLNRREFLRSWLRSMVLGGGGLLSYLLIDRKKSPTRPLKCSSLSFSASGVPTTGITAKQRGEPVTSDHMIWQIDPSQCVQCGQCATRCVLNPSAVKCVHLFSKCGYCKLCFAYFRPGIKILNRGAENQLCPTGAIRRRFIEDPYYEYMIDEALCIGCGKCVKGCNSFGNGSLCLQVRHDLCINCNECAIARECPSKAIKRVPASDVPLLKRGESSG